MNKIWVSLVGAAALVLAAGTATAETFRVGMEGAYPPFNNTDSTGKIVGFEVDLVNELCKRTGMTCEVMQQDWDGMIPALMNKRYDGIMDGMSITAERLKQIAFSVPYTDTPAWFVGAKDGLLKNAKSLADVKAALKGKTIGVQRSTTHQNFVEAEFKDTEIKLYDTVDELNFDLVNGRIDAGLNDSVSWSSFLNSDAGKGFTHFGPTMTGKDNPLFGQGVGIGLRQEDKELKAKLDKAIDSMKADGSLGKLAVQWFGYDPLAPGN
ncbi:transporter substrate-binding domain-containing protein [Inquilinus sp. YAF38]|uniref:transporter substrate-binding domain-containing protein n=1 Tax=Inquilinus sp. YAF38 TaxID=3233084 RepID=UPI003F92CCB0